MTGKAASATSRDYLSDLNTTPLIDVMLVLLIMFIISIPPQMHAIKLDLMHGDPPVIAERILETNKIVVTKSDVILWNGKPVTITQLDTLLRVIGAERNGQAEVQLQPEAIARYEQVNRVLKSVKQAQLTSFGFVGNEQYRDFVRPI
ncbi:MAG: biopolymer transporter ExbD [Pseudomonadota bacterium]